MPTTLDTSKEISYMDIEKLWHNDPDRPSYSKLGNPFLDSQTQATYFYTFYRSLLSKTGELLAKIEFAIAHTKYQGEWEVDRALKDIGEHWEKWDKAIMQGKSQQYAEKLPMNLYISVCDRNLNSNCAGTTAWGVAYYGKKGNIFETYMDILELNPVLIGHELKHNLMAQWLGSQRPFPSPKVTEGTARLFEWNGICDPRVVNKRTPGFWELFSDKYNGETYEGGATFVAFLLATRNDPNEFYAYMTNPSYCHYGNPDIWHCHEESAPANIKNLMETHREFVQWHKELPEFCQKNPTVGFGESGQGSRGPRTTTPVQQPSTTTSTTTEKSEISILSIFNSDEVKKIKAGVGHIQEGHPHEAAIAASQLSYLKGLFDGINKSINSPTYTGETILDVAIAEGCPPALIKILFENKFNFDTPIRQYNGHTPRDWMFRQCPVKKNYLLTEISNNYPKNTEWSSNSAYVYSTAIHTKSSDKSFFERLDPKFLVARLLLGLANGVTPLAFNRLIYRLKNSYPNQHQLIDLLIGCVVFPLMSAGITTGYSFVMDKPSVSGLNFAWNLAPAIGIRVAQYGINSYLEKTPPPLPTYTPLSFDVMKKTAKRWIIGLHRQGHLATAFRVFYFLHTLGAFFSSQEFQENPVNAGIGEALMMLASYGMTFALQRYEITDLKKNTANDNDIVANANSISMLNDLAVPTDVTVISETAAKKAPNHDKNKRRRVAGNMNGNERGRATQPLLPGNPNSSMQRPLNPPPPPPPPPRSSSTKPTGFSAGNEVANQSLLPPNNHENFTAKASQGQRGFFKLKNLSAQPQNSDSELQEMFKRRGLGGSNE